MPYPHIDPIIPSANDARLAKAARLTLQKSDCAGQSLRVQVSTADHKTTTLELPEVVTRLLLDILKQTAAGNAVTLVSIEAEITTQQAADLLMVSRPYLIRLVENGTLPARMVGKHRRLQLRDVLARKADQFAKRSKVLDELAAYDQELGLI